MPWAAAIGGIGSLVGGILGSNAQSEASAQEVAQQQQALAFEKQIYGTAQGNLNPFIGTGTSALYSLASLYGLPGKDGQVDPSGAEAQFQKFTQLPSYTFGLQQGNLGANRSLAASGLTGSGAQAKALSQFNQGYASQGFNGYIGQLASLAGLGQSSAVSLGNIGNQNAQLQSNTYGQIGAAQAAGTIGSANSLAGGIQGALGGLGSGLNSLFPTQSETSYLPQVQIPQQQVTQYDQLSPTGTMNSGS